MAAAMAAAWRISPAKNNQHQRRQRHSGNKAKEKIYRRNIRRTINILSKAARHLKRWRGKQYLMAARGGISI